MNQITADQIFHDLERLRKTNPIIHNVTNLVVMQTTANVLLAIGASPIMAHAPAELKEIAALANALVINIGTLDEMVLNAIDIAQEAALERKIPIIFDPVGAGATEYRTQAAKKILQAGVSVLRGNASEIMALVNASVITKGVDSTQQSSGAISAAKLLAAEHQCVVVISGATDIIIDAKQEIRIANGSALFTKVTGMGCSATAVIGAFAAINQDYFKAATHAMAAFTVAGEMAAKKTQAPGSFHTALLDNLFLLKRSDFDILNIHNDN